MKWLRVILVSFLIAGLTPLCVLGYMAYRGVENDEARALEKAEDEARRSIQQAESRFYERCSALVKQESARDFTEFQAWHAPLNLRAQAPSVVQSVLNAADATNPFIEKYFQLTLRDDQLIYQTPHSEEEVLFSAQDFLDDRKVGQLGAEDALILRRLRVLAGIAQSPAEALPIGPTLSGGASNENIELEPTPRLPDAKSPISEPISPSLAIENVYSESNRQQVVQAKPVVDNDILATNLLWRKVRDTSDELRSSRQATRASESLDGWSKLEGTSLDLDLYGRSQIEIYPYQRLAGGGADQMILFRYVMTPYSKILQGMLVDLESIEDYWEGEYGQLTTSSGLASHGIEYLPSDEHLALNPIDTDFEKQVAGVFPKLKLQVAPDTLGISAQYAGIRRDYGLVAGAYLVLLLLLGVVLYQTIHRHALLVQQQQDFVTAVSHELRTPLSSIRLQAEMLQNKPGVEEIESLKRGLGRIVHDEERLMRLVEMILTSTRIERRELDLQLQRAEPVSALERACEQARKQYPQRELILNNKSQGFVSQHDPAVAEQLFYNLIDNALKYSKEGAESVEIEVTGVGADLLVEVRDKGCGMAPKELKAVFKRFYRGAGANQYGAGTGLGLWLCDTYARMLDWSLDIKSTSGQGTCVSVKIPASSGGLSSSI